jgi:hypothetical protein
VSLGCRFSYIVQYESAPCKSVLSVFFQRKERIENVGQIKILKCVFTFYKVQGRE